MECGVTLFDLPSRLSTKDSDDNHDDDDENRNGYEILSGGTKRGKTRGEILLF